MNIQIFGAAALLLCGSVAAAQDAQDGETREVQATQTAQTQGENNSDEEGEGRGSEVVCRTERITGSLTRRRRTCLTRDEWAAIEAGTRDSMIRSGSNASGGQCIPTGMSGRC